MNDDSDSDDGLGPVESDSKAHHSGQISAPVSLGTSRDLMHDDDDFTSESSLVYRYCDDPPWYLAVVFGLQHLLGTIGGVYLSSLTLSRSLCADDDDIRVRVELFGNMAFVAGIATVAQVVLGIRLPIMMAPATGFVLPIVALTSLGTWECPNNASDILKMETFNHTFENSSVNEDSSVWKTRIRELQGGVMLASITQVVVGASGLFGFLLPRIRPLTVAPTVILIAMSSISFSSNLCEHSSWPLAVLVVGLVCLFGIYAKKIRVPWLWYQKKRKLYFIRYPLFKTCSVLFGMVIVWVLCVILTETEALPTDTASPAQYADPAYSEWAHNSKWFHLPYPGQYGTPTVSSVTYAGFVLSTLVSIVNSLACYHAVARVTHVPPPPAHAVNRAIIMEGLSGILGGSITGLPLTTHPPNIGVIGITQNASRSVAVVGGLLLCFCGLFSRFSSILAVQPRPVIGGAILVNACVIFSSAVAYAADVDLRTPRATTVLGVAVMMGSVLPDWSARNSDRLQTGNQQLDSALLAALSCGPLIGATVGFLMDLTVPGNSEDSLAVVRAAQLTSILEGQATRISIGTDISTIDTPPLQEQVYRLAHFSEQFQKYACSKYLTFLPTFVPECVCRRTGNSESTCHQGVRACVMRSRCCGSRDEPVSSDVEGNAHELTQIRSSL